MILEQTLATASPTSYSFGVCVCFCFVCSHVYYMRSLFVLTMCILIFFHSFFLFFSFFDLWTHTHNFSLFSCTYDCCRRCCCYQHIILLKNDDDGKNTQSRRRKRRKKKHKRHDKTLNINLYKHAFKITEKMLSPKILFVMFIHEYMEWWRIEIKREKEI